MTWGWTQRALQSCAELAWCNQQERKCLGYATTVILFIAVTEPFAMHALTVLTAGVSGLNAGLLDVGLMVLLSGPAI